MPDRVVITKSKLDGLAEAVGSKSGQGVPLTIDAMRDAVLGIETGIEPEGTLAITRNGTHDVTTYAEASVNVQPKLYSDTVHPTTSELRLTAPSGYDGLGTVTVEAMLLNERTVTPTTSEQVVRATGADGLSQVTVEAIPSEYIVPSGNLSITENAESVDVTNYATVSVSVQNGSAYQDQDGNIVLSDQGGSTVGVQALSVTSNGTYTAPTGTAYSPVTVNVSGGSTDPIRFFDYDGTLVASYASVPASLPSIPTHSNLTNGTWNHTLAQVASQFAATGTCDVGANYDTTSGKNEIDVTLDSDHLKPFLYIAVNGTATVDWGDGSSTNTLTGTSFTTLYYFYHTYAQAGEYTITIDGTVGFYNTSSSYSAVLRQSNASQSINRGYSRAYSKCVTAIRVANGSRIGNNAFCNCPSLTSVSIPDSVTSIGSYAFDGCYSLNSVSIPDSVTSIGNNAFSNCGSLASISIPDSVTSIGGSVFNGCYTLNSVSIPDSVTSIGNNAFSNCRSLASISIPDGVTSIGSNVFNGCYSLTSVSIPDGVTSIGSSAFNYCEGLNSVSIPDSVTSIGGYAFNGCYTLNSVSIPDGVTSIGGNVFNGCYSLNSVSIPDSVTSIGNNAFQNCYGMLEYHLLPTTPPTLSSTNVFSGIVASTVIYVPVGCLEAYQTANYWSTYANYMREESS